MKFRTTLTPKNQSEYIKSWTSVYQTGLMQFRKKREATDVGFLRPATFYLFALILGYFIVSWGMQMFTTSFVSVEVLFGILVLFFIAFHIAYGIRPKWFRFLAKRGIFYKGELEVECDNEGIRFGVSEAGEKSFWKWQELTKVIPFARTLVLYNKECDSFSDAKGHVLLINKEDLSEDEWNTLNETYIKPLQIQNKFRAYYSYSDIVIFLMLCLLIALAALPYALRM